MSSLLAIPTSFILHTTMNLVSPWLMVSVMTPSSSKAATTLCNSLPSFLCFSTNPLYLETLFTFLISPCLNLLNLTIPSRYMVMAARFPTSPSMLMHLFKSSTPWALKFLILLSFF